ncbi:RNA polymerase sigma-70 factor, ECF subfamily [Chitinophaga sp. YR573]|uniref:RNA polymerase sigma factor n=1 Tax=Chitinophaga sp. YR573 TaxID=1881040 RepID=UPI0008CCE2C5|nr:RNA polymerase sigma-70 factor [Chitinophaga sp. YR573]SEW44308.1 RNA polymerase sigma-70 factor, ECF subfamily [Chitinophaga sp. YR573]
MSANSSQILFDEFFARNNEKVYRFALKLTEDHNMAQEITQQCFIRLWENIDQVNNERDIFPLLFVYVKNLVIDNSRQSYREKKMLAKAALSKPPEKQENDLPLLMREYEQKLEKVIEKMPDQRKTVYQLSRKLGYSHKEIASKLSISPATVKNHLTTALQFIRKELLMHYDIKSE